MPRGCWASPADIFLPDGCRSVKQTMIRLFGGTLHLGGVDIDDAKERARKFCTSAAAASSTTARAARLIEGAGTIGDEIGAALEDVDYAFVPMGSGSLAAGVAIGLKGASSGAQVIAVQSAGSPAMVESFRAKRAVERPVNSLADIHRLPRARRDGAHRLAPPSSTTPLLVTDRDLLAALNTLLTWAIVWSSRAAAAGLAGAWAAPQDLRGSAW